jgi:hypothetical protein
VPAGYPSPASTLGLSTVTQVEKHGPISWQSRDLDFEALKASPQQLPSEEAE